MDLLAENRLGTFGSKLAISAKDFTFVGYIMRVWFILV